MGSVLGLSPWQSPGQLYDNLKGFRKFEGNVATRWGTDNEVNGVAEYTLQTGRHVSLTGFHPHRFIDFIGGSPDGLVGDEGMIEVKCPYSKKLSWEVPLHYYPQINALLEITGREWCDYVCWTPEETTIIRVKANREAFDYYLDTYRNFYTCLTLDNKPGVALSKEKKEEIRQKTEEFVKQDTVDVFDISESQGKDAGPPFKKLKAEPTSPANSPSR